MSPNPVQIERFTTAHAAAIATWVRHPQEMTWLSPETTFPLTAGKVLSWAGPDRRQFIFRIAADVARAAGVNVLSSTGPMIAYAELNDMPTRSDQLWVGHMLLDSNWRGRSLGMACLQTLLRLGFENLAATEIVLVVVPDNDRAIRCYLRSGFLHAGDEWKRMPHTNEPYRLLRMVIDRPRYRQLRAAGLMPQAWPEPAAV